MFIKLFVLTFLEILASQNVFVYGILIVYEYQYDFLVFLTFRISIKHSSKD